MRWLACAEMRKERLSIYICISPAEEDWTTANGNEMYRVAALTRNVLQHCGLKYFHGQSGLLTCLCLPCCHGFSLGPLRPPGCSLTPFPGAVPRCLAFLVLRTASVMTMSPIFVCTALLHCDLLLLMLRPPCLQAVMTTSPILVRTSAPHSGRLTCRQC
jgi:hypothetical protein